MEQTTIDYKFKDGEKPPTFPQCQRYAKGLFGENLTQAEASKEITKLLTKLGEEVVEFTLTNPTNTATISQYAKIGDLSAKVNGVYSMSAISKEISKQ